MKMERGEGPVSESEIRPVHSLHSFASLSVSWIAGKRLFLTVPYLTEEPIHIRSPIITVR